MARDNYKNSDQIQSSLTNLDEDSIPNLPDLSAFKDSEKQHILSVLIRNEELRNKHLLRFMTLRKEVVDLEQQPPPTSPSVCARCQRRFGFLFNTGDACPKCGVNVCKQCRLMYNVNDNGWLCQLCCKQMQLMSYSGEWIYAIHSNLRKDSLNSSEVLDETIPLSVSTQNMAVISSSDSDPEIFVAATTKPDRFASKLAVPVAKPTKSKPKIKANAMVVQNSIDEKKLNYIRERINERPLNESYTQPLPRRAHRIASPASTQKNSSREVNSTLNDANSRQGRSLNKENSSVAKNVEILKVKEQEADFMSVTSSEWGGDDNNNKLEKEKLKVQQQQTSSPQKKQQNPQLSTGDSRLNVASATTKKSRRERLSASMQSLRNTVTRHPLSSSRTSLSSEKNKKDEILNSSIINDEDTTISSKIKDEPSKSKYFYSSMSNIDCAFYSTMTEFYHHEQQQQKELTEPSSIVTRTEMPSFYPATKHRTLITKQLTDRDDDDDDDPNSIYKEAFIVQIFQHWRDKTFEHQHAMNHSGNNTTSDDFSSRESAHTVSTMEISDTETIPPETSSNNNKDEVSNINEPGKPITTMQKRVKPIPASYARRKEAFKKSIPLPTDFLNPNLLAPYTKNKSRTTAATKKNHRPLPIFIAPKKTQPSPIPRSFSLFSFDESNHNKRKHTFERNISVNDDQFSPPISPICAPTPPISPTRTTAPPIPSTWAPAPPTTPSRFCVQSPGSPPDDETSSDDGCNESLLIRNKKGLKKPTKTNKERNPFYVPPNIIIPRAIFVTDPNGYSRSYDMNGDFMEDIGLIIDDDVVLSNINNEMNRPVSPSNLEKYSLHSIGEEDEESIEKNNKDGIILTKELNRIEAFKRSRQTNTDVQKNNTNLDENDKVLLGRRWSDSVVSDDDEHTQPPQSRLVKMASTTSVTKQPTTPPAKVSITKYLLMKLHLTSSSNKDDDSNASTNQPPPPPPPRKHSHTNRSISQSSVDDSKQASSNKSRHESINTVVSPTTTESKSFRKQVSIADSVVTIKSDYSEQDNKPSTTGNRSSVARNEDDIDRTFEKGKLAPSKRATSLRDLRGSQLSLSSFMSEAKARFDLEITGTIELKLSHQKNTGSFDIFIKQCTNLAAAKRGQTSNPYCKIYLLPDKSKDSKRKTGIRKGTTNPIFGETLRYHLSEHEFKTRTLWISVWNDSSLGHNDFLGEIHVPLANCKLDQLETYPLQSRVQPEQKEEASAVESTVEVSEISFELSFIENTNNKENKKDLGTIQVNAIQAKGIYQGKNNVELICKGLLMPDKIKRKLPTASKGPSPKWDIPLRWESVRLKDLENISMEISIWSQERFRKTMIGYVRLNSARKHLDSREVKFLVATQKEKSYWEAFQEYPTRIHRVKLPLRSATNEYK